MMQNNKPPILVVDDEPEILYSLSALLRREFVVHTAESGTEALRVMEREEIHVVMADQRMPGLTGVELLARVKSEWPEAVRLVFTGYADVKAVIAAINQGHVFRYITKPWDPDELLCVLGQACEEHRRLAAQRRLLSDLREYQAQTLAFLEGLRSGPSGAPGLEQKEPVDRLLETGHTLLARLEQLPEPEEALET